MSPTQNPPLAPLDVITDGVPQEVAARPESQRAAEFLVEHAADALYLMDTQGRVTFMNPAAEKLFGWSRDELLGQVLHDVIHPRRPDGSENPFSECPLGSVMKTGRVLVNHEDSFQHRDGSFVPVSCSNAPVFGPDGALQGAALVVRDLSERKRLELELRARAEALAESDRCKDQFMAMLAHELRNPLAAMANAVGLLRLRPEDAAVRQRAVGILERQVKQQARLVEDLLDVSRLVTGKTTLRKARVDLVRVVMQEVEDRRRELESAGLRLELEPPSRPLWMEGDAVRLAQVVGNLLSNAVRFSDRGGTVAIRLFRAGGGHAVLSVRDTGIGIDPELLPTLFEPFFQADRSLERTLGGLGLGLTMVRGWVELHGGSVRAHSEGQTRGAEFTVTLPIEEETFEAGKSSQELQAPAAGRRVLIIEDNHDAADSLHDMIELFGHEAEVSYDGLDGVEAARRLRPDIILCDVGLPGLDGYAVARALRGEAGLSKTVLIAISGYGQEEARQRSREAGFDLHLVKPVDADKLEVLLAQPPAREGSS